MSGDTDEDYGFVAGQLAQLRPGDVVTATFIDPAGQLYKVTGALREAGSGQGLLVGGELLRTYAGEVATGNRLQDVRPVHQDDVPPVGFHTNQQGETWHG